LQKPHENSKIINLKNCKGDNMIGTSELIIIALVIILLFGGAQLPKLARSLGGFISEFNKAKETPRKKTRTKKATK
jgi:sec-independent protein translocase protein TatA